MSKQILKEALLIVPKTNNNGESLLGVRDEAIASLIAAFGGATVSESEGFWRDEKSGKLFAEPVWRIVTAYAARSPSGNALLEAVAYRVGVKGKQEAVYFRLPSGNVRILDTRAAPERHLLAASHQ